MEFKVLKRSHLKRNIIIGVMVVAIISAVVLNFSQAKYKLTESIPLIHGTINYTPYDFKVIAMYQANDSGEYVEIESMPSSGYTINEELSYCTLDNVNKDNEAILYTDTEGQHVFAGLKKNSKCYLYFNESDKMLAIDVIESAHNNQTMLIYDDYNNLRYAGSNPNNYVYFNCDDYSNPNNTTCELWRIIGIFNEDTHGISGQKLLKLIRDESLGNIAWNSNNVNDWTTSSLQVTLNGDYLNGINSYASTGIKNDTTRNMITTVTWKLGGSTSYTDVTARMYYERERGTSVYSGHTTTLSGKIGLMYASDFGYATSGSSSTNRDTCLATELFNWSSGFNDCRNQDWLNKNQWTLIPDSSNSVSVFYITTAGFVGRSGASHSYGVYPSLYLSSNVSIAGGSGTSANPYTLALN